LSFDRGLRGLVKKFVKFCVKFCLEWRAGRNAAELVHEFSPSLIRSKKPWTPLY